MSSACPWRSRGFSRSTEHCSRSRSRDPNPLVRRVLVAEGVRPVAQLLRQLQSPVYSYSTSEVSPFDSSSFVPSSPRSAPLSARLPWTTRPERFGGEFEDLWRSTDL